MKCGENLPAEQARSEGDAELMRGINFIAPAMKNGENLPAEQARSEGDAELTRGINFIAPWR